MAIRKPYELLLLDRRWQRKRLEVFDGANWKCEKCGDFRDEIPLHAHHIEYLPGKEPWSYPPGKIVSVCEFCHQEAHGKRETSWALREVQRQMEDAHASGNWDKFMDLASKAQQLVDAGYYYKGLV